MPLAWRRGVPKRESHTYARKNGGCLHDLVAGRRLSICGPVAHGRPWFQRARYLSAPFVRPFVVVRCVTGHTVDGSRCSILVVDDGVPIKLLLAVLLAGQTQTIAVGKVSILGVPALLRREVAEPRLGAGKSAPGPCQDVFPDGLFAFAMDCGYASPGPPRWQSAGSTAVAKRWAAPMRAGDSKATWRCSAVDRPISTCSTRRCTNLSQVHGTVMRRRSFRSTLRQALQRGTIVWVEQDGRPIAAQLLERCGSTLHTIAVGTSLEPAAVRATGVLTALKVAASDLAIEAGSNGSIWAAACPGSRMACFRISGNGAQSSFIGAGFIAACSRLGRVGRRLRRHSWPLAPICRHGETTFSVTTMTTWSHKAAQQLALRGIIGFSSSTIASRRRR